MLGAGCWVPGAGRGQVLLLSKALKKVSALWLVASFRMSPALGVWPLEVSLTILTHLLTLGITLRSPYR